MGDGIIAGLVALAEGRTSPEQGLEASKDVVKSVGQSVLGTVDEAAKFAAQATTAVIVDLVG
jgi:hypothetical protein